MVVKQEFDADNGKKFKTEKLWYILLIEDKYYLEYYKYCTVS